MLSMLLPPLAALATRAATAATGPSSSPAAPLGPNATAALLQQVRLDRGGRREGFGDGSYGNLSLFISCIPTGTHGKLASFGRA